MPAKKYTDELIAYVLDAVEPSPAAKRWLETEAGRRELEAYQQTLGLVRARYGQAAPKSAPRVFYTALDTGLGPLLIAATGAGLVRLAFGRNERAFAEALRRQLNAEVVKAAQPLAHIAAQLKEYLSGRRETFDVPLDLSLATPFQRDVLQAARRIPRGQTLTYSDVARRIGRPRAARAVGQALSRNPIPIVIPCHRVLAADGTLRGYLGSGVETKARLLALEGARAA